MRRHGSARFPRGTGRWGINRASFREGGLPHQLLVVTDLTRPLREEKMPAWQRIVRVLGHELNNSLTPIKSIAGSLESMVAKDELPEELAGRHEARPGDHWIAIGSAEPVHGRLRQIGEAAASAVGAGGDWAIRPSHSPRLETRIAVRVEDGPAGVVRAIATNWNNC